MNTETNGVICIKGAVSALSVRIVENFRASRSVPEPETVRDALEDGITARQMIISEAQSQIAALKSRQNELPPIHHLSVEVLSIILSMALPLKCHHRERTNLLLVCRAWTSIINENPSTFWATLSAEDPLTQRARLLRKAGQMPVTIVADSRYTSDESAEDFVQYIKSNDIPFHELVVHQWDDTVMEAVFADCLAAPAPQLRSLDLEVEEGWILGGEDPNSQHLRMFSGIAPSLKSVRLCGVRIPWNSAILQNLLSLTLEYPHYSEGGTPSLEQMLGILRGCPALQSLILRGMGFERSNGVQLPPLSLDRLTTINLSMSPLQSIFSLLRHIRFPKTVMVALAGETSTPLDDDNKILNATLYLLQQHLSIKSFHLAINHSVVEISTTGLKFSILNRARRKHSSYYTEVFSRLSSPIRTAITSLYLDFTASQHPRTPPSVLNEIIAKLTNLPVDHPHLPKSEKPWNVVLEEVAQTSEDVGRPASFCPNLRSLEITVGHRNRLDLAAILQLVRIRKSDIVLNGKQVIMAPITFIRITFEARDLPLGQMDVLNELKSEVADVQYVMPSAMDEEQAMHNILDDFIVEDSSLSSLSASSDSSDSD